MNFTYYYLAKLFLHLSNEGNMTITFFCYLLLVLVSFPFLFIRQYFSERKMKKTTKMIANAKSEGVDSLIYKDGKMEFEVTFKSMNKKEKLPRKGILKRVK